MRRREFILLVVGLTIGLLVGIGMMAASKGLRDAVGTAADSPDDDGQSVLNDVEFYLADIDSTREWLLARSPDDSQQITLAIDTLVSLPGSPQFRQDFLAARQDLDLVLPRLVNDLSIPLAMAENEDKFKISACLGMDDNPYSPAPTLYFYLTIPRVENKSLGLPSEWVKLDKPKSNTLFWLLLECYPSAENPASEG